MRVSFISQVFAIVRYEMLIQWRRGSLKMILILLVFAPLSLIALGTAPDSLSQLALRAASVEALPAITMDVATFATATQLPLLLFALPLYVSETIPYDRQHGVRDLFDALPLGVGTYLSGKVLAVWGAVLIAILVSAAFNGLVSTVVFGTLDPTTWTVMWAGGFLVLGWVASGISILIASGQPNRRRAVLVGFASLPIYFIVYALSPLATRITSALLRISIVPMSSDALSSAPVGALPSSWGFIAWSLLGMVVIWATVWGWMRWRANSQ